MGGHRSNVHDNNDEFSKYFQELLDIPWDGYLAMDEELELEQPARAPNAQAYSIDVQDQEPNESSPAMPIVTYTEALDHLLNIQKSNIGDTKLFDLLEQAMSHIQSDKSQTEINSKNVQSSLIKFFSKS